MNSSGNSFDRPLVSSLTTPTTIFLRKGVFFVRHKLFLLGGWIFRFFSFCDCLKFIFHVFAVSLPYFHPCLFYLYFLSRLPDESMRRIYPIYTCTKRFYFVISIFIFVCIICTRALLGVIRSQWKKLTFQCDAICGAISISSITPCRPSVATAAAWAWAVDPGPVSGSAWTGASANRVRRCRRRSLPIRRDSGRDRYPSCRWPVCLLAQTWTVSTWTILLRWKRYVSHVVRMGWGWILDRLCGFIPQIILMKTRGLWCIFNVC